MKGSVLTAVPKSIFCWDFVIMEGSRETAHIKQSWWREKGTLTVQGVEYSAFREAILGGDFILQGSGSAPARAKKPSAMRRRFLITHKDKTYSMRAVSFFCRKFLLFDGDREIGSLAPEGVFTRRASIDLPESLPLPVRVFIFWLALLMWKRNADAGAAGA